MESLRTGLQDQDDEIRLKAAKGLVRVGPSAGSATSNLVDVLQKDKVPAIRMEAATALGRIFWRGCNPRDAELGIPALARVMRNDKDTLVRRSAIYAFRMIGPLAKDAAPDLLELMKNEDDDFMRELARNSFIKVVGTDNTALSAPLLEMFKKGIDDYHTEFVVIEALGKIGANDKILVPLLIDALEGKGLKNSRCRGAAAYALGYMGPKAKSAVPSLVNVLVEGSKLKIEDPKCQWSSVLTALEDIGPDAHVAIPTIKKIADDPAVDPRIRQRAERSLERLQERKPK